MGSILKLIFHVITWLVKLKVINTSHCGPIFILLKHEIFPTTICHCTIHVSFWDLIILCKRIYFENVLNIALNRIENVVEMLNHYIFLYQHWLIPLRDELRGISVYNKLCKSCLLFSLKLPLQIAHYRTKESFAISFDDRQFIWNPPLILRCENVP